MNHASSPVSTTHAAPLPEGTSPDILVFYKYWLSLPRTGLLPRLSDYLDHAPARLQPFAAIADVVSPTNIKLRLMGTGLVTLVGRDPTGQQLNLLYSESLRPMMNKVVWQVASRPTAYIAVRNVRTRGGQVVQNPTICLPLANPPSPVISIITYSKISGAIVDLADHQQLEMVQDLRISHWIDIGAGVPEF